MKRVVWLALLATAACAGHTGERALPFYRDASLTPEWIAPDSPAAADLHRVPAFRLVDQRGDTITTATTAGHIYVANFFLTGCGVVCPLVMHALTAVQDTFAGDTGVLILSHSVTPETDSVPVLAQYARQHNIRADGWHLLTGDAGQIAQLAGDGYLLRRRSATDTTRARILHTEVVLLIDDEGRIRGAYDGSLAFDMTALIADIRALKGEAAARRQALPRLVPANRRSA